MNEVLTLTSDSSAPARARRFVTEYAVGFSPELMDDALLIVSELVTNALCHGRPTITVSLAALAPGDAGHPGSQGQAAAVSAADPHTPTGPGLRISVSDEGDMLPAVPTGPASPQQRNGRGLLLVAMLSTAWGVHALEPAPGKVVWSELRS